MECSSDKTNTTKSSNSSPRDQEYYYSSQNSTTTTSNNNNITSVQIAKKVKNNIIVTPCAACKILRRRCVSDKCILAPYFPPAEPLKFTIAHRVFGASNIIKLLQDLPEYQRADAVSSLVYEANARIRDPIYGSTGTICHLQKQVSDLQAELAKAQAELVNLQCQQANLMALICMDNTIHLDPPQSISQLSFDSQSFLVDDANYHEAVWEIFKT